jgi:hypothetical protein
MSADADAADRCPRCHGDFFCGAAGPGPCACATVALGAALQARLRMQFRGCLCPNCLRALAEAEAAAGGTSMAGSA